jgi:hypothetical protein
MGGGWNHVGSCPIMGSDVSGVEHVGSVTTELALQNMPYSKEGYVGYLSKVYLALQNNYTRFYANMR